VSHLRANKLKPVKTKKAAFKGRLFFLRFGGSSFLGLHFGHVNIALVNIVRAAYRQFNRPQHEGGNMIAETNDTRAIVLITMASAM
jgi:hypothetical protein